MLLLEKRSWWSQITTLRGSVLLEVWPRLVIVTLVATAVTIAHEYFSDAFSTLTVIPFTLIAVALGIFLGFRNNTSYDRFWEGRKLWGKLVNTTRSLARQIRVLVAPDAEAGATDDATAELHRELVYRVIAYVHALRMHLRDETDIEQLKGLLPEEDRAALPGELNRPIAILRELGDRLRELWQAGAIHPLHPAPPRAEPDHAHRYSRRMRAHQEHADPQLVHDPDSPDRRAVYVHAAVRHRAHRRRAHAGGRCHHRLRLLRPGRRR